MTLLDVLILALAVGRLASLLSAEEGPYSLLDKLRRAAGVRYDERSMPVGGNEFAKLLICPWCLSVWLGIGAAALYALWPAVVWLALPLALSALALLWHKLVDR